MENENIDDIYNRIMANLEKLDLIIKKLTKEKENEEEHTNPSND